MGALLSTLLSFWFAGKDYKVVMVSAPQSSARVRCLDQHAVIITHAGGLGVRTALPRPCRWRG